MFIARNTHILVKHVGSRCVYSSFSSTVSSDEINETDGFGTGMEDRDYGGRAFRRHGQLEPLYATADHWLENEGKQFCEPKDGPNWLGGRVVA